VSRALALLFTAALVRVASASPDDLVARPLVLDQGQLDGRIVGEIDLYPGYGGKPVSLAPDLWFGVLPALTVGVIHSDLSLDRIGAGASICIEPRPFTCPKAYHGSGLDVLYSLVAGNFAAAAHARFLVRELDPIEPAITIGAALRWHSGRWSISGDPFLQIGLANLAHGNRAQLWLPIVFAAQPTPRWAIELHTGWNSDLAIIRDGYYVPFGIGTHVRATSHLDVGAVFGFMGLLGPQNETKDHVLLLDVGWRT
jgi:hypothetical protein